MKSEAISIAGVDGCKDGWLAVIERSNGELDVRIFSSFSKIVDDQELQLVVIDVPIGLTEGGPRICDIEARKFIGPRRSSVFPAPIRPMLIAASRAEASMIGKGVDGRGCSQQTWAITAGIKSADECMTPELQQRISEGHPEVSFALMNDGFLTRNKREPEGRKLRVRLLERDFPNLRSLLAAFSSMRAEEDIIDAFACLWTARRIKHDAATRFPSDAILDDHNLRMQIVA